MFLSAKRICTFCCLFLYGLMGCAQDAAITKKLDDLKKQNNLAEWLYITIDYANAHLQQPLLLANAQKQVWRQPVNPPEQIAWLTLLSSEGYNELQAGNILSSIDHYEEAYTYFLKHKVVQFDVVEYVLKPLGNNYTRLGDYERALYIQLKSVERLDAFDNQDDIASIYSNIAITCYNMGNYDDALRYINKGLALAKEPEVYFRLQNTLANVWYEKGVLTKALTVLKQIISQQKESDKTYFSLYNAYQTLGTVYIRLNDLDKAVRSLKKALQMINMPWLKDDYVRERAATITQLGKVQRLKNQPQAALPLFDQALRMLRIDPDAKDVDATIYGENKLVDLFHEKALTRLQLHQDENALQNMRYALLATDKMRIEFADSKTKERLQQEGKELAEQAIEIAYRLYKKNKDQTLANLILYIAEQTKARTLADQIRKNDRQLAGKDDDTIARKRLAMERAIAYNQLLMMTEKNNRQYQKKIADLKFDLALLNKSYRKQIDASVRPAAEILKTLPDNLHVLEFFFGTNSLFEIEISKRVVSNVIRIDSAQKFRKNLNHFITAYYHNGPDAMVNNPRAFRQESYRVYQTLFNQIKLQNQNTLCLVPDDVLGYLSFDGLVTDNKNELPPSQWPYLIKKASISYAFSLNTLAANQQGNKANEGFSGLFITHNEINDKPIVAVKQEADAIKQLVSGNYQYDSQVNIASFFDAFDNSAVMHISTHAYLSGTDKQPTLDLGEQKLFLFQLLSRQHKPNLIVLSACRTGDGLLAGGEGIISLSRGFSAIGTPATVASLWNVNDEAAATITAAMYAGLVKLQSSATALHNAKLNWLNGQQVSDTMYLPYYWDSLVLMGADTQLPLKPAKHLATICIIIASIVFFGVMVLIIRKIRQTKRY